MRVLLTGGSGFLGQQVTRLLANQGVNIFHLTRKSVCADQEILWDFTNALPKLPQVDALVHLAEAVDYSESVKDLVLCNTIPAIRLAEWALCNNTPVFYTSTASVHGKNIPWGASAALAPTGKYEVSKLLSEEAFRIISPQYTIFRMHGVYGVTGPSHLGLNLSMRNALLCGRNPVLHGSGLGLRNYICVDDAAAWIVDSVCTLNTDCRIVYMAGPETMPIRQWLQAIVDKLLPSGKIEELSGESTTDIVVEPSVAPVPLVAFEEYLLNLKEHRHEI